MLMRQLVPAATDEVDTLDAYALEGGDGPHVRVNMVTSVDGAAAVDGRVGVLSGHADQVLLHDLRTLCDVLLVGAGTVRAEGYGPLTLDAEQQRRRTASAQAPVPRLAVLTRTIDLDLSAPVFTEATRRPLVLTSRRASPARRAEAEEVADVLVGGDEEVDLAAAFAELAARGLPRILSEGGPRVLAALFAADLVDELCLAVAPLVVCGAGPRITSGPKLPQPAGMRLAHLLECDEYLFLRYTRATEAAEAS